MTEISEPTTITPRPRGRPRTAGTPGPKRPRVLGQRPVQVDPVLKLDPTAPEAAVKPENTPRQYLSTIGRRKRAVARVCLYHEGQGEIEINGQPLATYFPTSMLQNSAQEALAQSPVKNSVRIVVKVQGGGKHGQAGAVRLGIARALLKIDETLRPVLRARGYLTRDPREKERKKPGLKRARRAPQWQKR